MNFPLLCRSTNVETELAVPFPAVTVCDNHYDFKRLAADQGFPRNPFKPVPDPIWTAPDYKFKTLFALSIKSCVDVESQGDC